MTAQIQEETVMTSPSNDPEGRSTVVNLCRLPLIDSGINLLSKRLSFCHTSQHLNKIKTVDDLDSFFRCLRLREFFIDEEEEEENDADILFHPSKHVDDTKR